MICTCSTHFCFLCSSYLPPDEPYAHFNTRGTSCYMQLWHGEHGDQEPVGDAPLAGGAPREQVPVMPPAEAAQVLAEENAAPLAEELDLIELQRAFIIEFDDGSDTEPENEIAFEDVPDEPLPPAPGRARGRGRGRGGGEERGRGRGRGGELRGVRGERVRDARPGWIHRRERLVQE